MILYYVIGLGIGLLGIITVVMLMIHEKRQEAGTETEKAVPVKETGPDPAELLRNLELEGKAEESPDSHGTVIPAKGTRALRLNGGGDSGDEPRISEAEVELSLQCDTLKRTNKELEEKYTRLEGLFEEKGRELEKIRKALDQHERTSKEFNKLKDVLEKELKDTKDANKTLQKELETTRSEVEALNRRILQLEETVKESETEAKRRAETAKSLEAELVKAKDLAAELEKSILEKNRKIEDLVRRLHDAASAETEREASRVSQGSVVTDKGKDSSGQGPQTSPSMGSDEQNVDLPAEESSSPAAEQADDEDEREAEIPAEDSRTPEAGNKEPAEERERLMNASEKDASSMGDDVKAGERKTPECGDQSSEEPAPSSSSSEVNDKDEEEARPIEVSPSAEPIAPDELQKTSPDPEVHLPPDIMAGRDSPGPAGTEEPSGGKDEKQGPSDAGSDVTEPPAEAPPEEDGSPPENKENGKP